jgi:hypothetical protein
MKPRDLNELVARQESMRQEGQHLVGEIDPGEIPGELIVMLTEAVSEVAIQLAALRGDIGRILDRRTADDAAPLREKVRQLDAAIRRLPKSQY